jgi:hypothetical protein
LSICALTSGETRFAGLITSPLMVGRRDIRGGTGCSEYTLWLPLRLMGSSGSMSASDSDMKLSGEGGREYAAEDWLDSVLMLASGPKELIEGWVLE